MRREDRTRENKNGSELSLHTCGVQNNPVSHVRMTALGGRREAWLGCPSCTSGIVPGINIYASRITVMVGREGEDKAKAEKDKEERDCHLLFKMRRVIHIPLASNYQLIMTSEVTEPGGFSTAPSNLFHRRGN